MSKAMRKLGDYFLVGCVIVGVAMGGIYAKCPDEDAKLPPVADLIGAVVLWPMLVTAAVFAAIESTPEQRARGYVCKGGAK